MYEKKVNLRAEHRLRENQRVQDSPSLETMFPQLKSLTVNLAHFDATISRKASELKYTINLPRAKSLFRFDCSNPECVGGDFDLSEDLRRAVGARLETVTGEARCHGWRSKTTIDNIRCERILRYELIMGYGPAHELPHARSTPAMRG